MVKSKLGFSQGETIEEALENTRDAIESHIACLKEEGQEVKGDEGLMIGRVDIAV